MRQRFRRRPPLSFWLLSGLVALVLGRWWSDRREAAPALAEGFATVTGIVDGSTLQVKNSDAAAIQVRLLGIRVSDSSAAEAWLSEKLAGREVYIELDKRRRAADGANLAYVYVDDTFVNAKLIRQGCAKHDAYPGDSASHAKQLREAK
jgi:endonuclease YncB( thermonuclease family)